MVEEANNNNKGKARCRTIGGALDGSEGVLQLFHLLVRDLGELRGVLQGVREELLHQKLLLARLARLIEQEDEEMEEVNVESTSSAK